MSEDNILGGAQPVAPAEPTTPEEPVSQPETAPVEEVAAPEKTPEELAAEEAKAEEEFISTPEDTVENPLVEPESVEETVEPEAPILEGAIGSGNLQSNQKEEEVASAPVSNELNAASQAVENAMAANATSTVAGEPKKKSKKGLVITLIIVFLLLIGGGVAFLIWFLMGNSPENMLKDALSKIWDAENVQATATLDVTNDKGEKINLTLDGVLAGADVSGSGKIKTKQDGKDIEIEFSAAYSKDGAAYFKFTGLKKLVEGLTGSSSSDDEDDEDGTGAMVAMLSGLLGGVVEKIDGEWYKVTASEAKDMGSDEISCVLENMKGVMDPSTKKEIKSIYEKNPFLVVKKDANVEEKDGVKYIKVTVDKEKSKSFADETKNIDSLKKIAACSTSDEKDDEKEEKSEPVITLGVKSMGHELVSMNVKQDENSMDVKLTYDKKDASIPSDAKNIDDLKEAIAEGIKDGIGNFAQAMCEAQYGDYGQQFVDLCKSQAMSEMGDIDADTLLKNLNFGGSSSIDL
ncbi:MAG: hypothetical protein MJ154_00320 [Candidatus Saccharibacteria bacterium]|nr:hypothetical protein [Candidatus Saccharibacteria bacterium]